MDAFPDSPLAGRLRRLRRLLPGAALLVVVLHQAVEHTWLKDLSLPLHFLTQILFYGLLGPLLAWGTLVWIEARVRERDRAEARLQLLYRLSQEVAAAPDLEGLVDLALRAPEAVLTPAGTGLLLREEGPEPRWRLVGTRHLPPRTKAVLEERLRALGPEVPCPSCLRRQAAVGDRCPLLPPAGEGGPRALLCLPLAGDPSPLALLHVYLDGPEALDRADRSLLESMAAALGVALERTRWQTRARRTLERVDRTVQRPQTLRSRVEGVVRELVEALQARGGAVALRDGSGAWRWLVRWPGGFEPGEVDRVLPALSPTPEGAPWIPLPGEGSFRRGPPSGQAIPLRVEGDLLGWLLLWAPVPSPDREPLLRTVATTLALLIRNHQLLGELESQAVLQERHRLAREVHDGLAQVISFLNLKVQQLGRRLERGSRAELRPLLEELRQGILELDREVRMTLEDLRWPWEGEGSLAERLRTYLETVRTRTGLEGSLDVRDLPPLPPRIAVQLFRVAQEALTNVVRHAGARRIWVRLAAEGDGIVLEVCDDGRGVEGDPFALPGHFGLRIARERVEGLGGRLALEPREGGGTCLRVWVPVRIKEAFDGIHPDPGGGRPHPLPAGPGEPPGR